MNDSGHRFIEESFPVKEVGANGIREKNVHAGYITNLHVWWARRPLGVSRATAYASLVQAASNAEEWQKKRDFISRMSAWEETTNAHILDKANADIRDAFDGAIPKVIDPFSGGGSYPLEAMRLGCETYANDYNPVAAVLLKATLEFPRLFGGQTETHVSSTVLGQTIVESRSINPLIEAVRHWGEWVLRESAKELSAFYPADESGLTPSAYIWMRTVPCQNPTCGIAIPLARQYWLIKPEGKRAALYPEVVDGDVRFRIVGDNYGDWPSGFNPDLGTVLRAVVVCPACGASMDDKTTRQLFNTGQSGEKLAAVVLVNPAKQGKIFRPATIQDVQLYIRASELAALKQSELFDLWGMNPIPDESLPAAGTLGFRIQRYGMNTWGDLFNARQKLAMVTIVNNVRRSYVAMQEHGYSDDFKTAVVTYLALLVDRIANFSTRLCRWENAHGLVKQIFARQALAMLWDYAEANPIGKGSGSGEEQLGSILGALTYLCKGLPAAVESGEKPTGQSPRSVTITCGSATNLPYPDDYFDAVLTDPPYYDNVPYSYLSDFFYVWLKRTVSEIYPDLMATPLTPKAGEIVAYANRDGGADAGKQFFESSLKSAFQEIHRVLKPNGIAVVVYAHKSAAGWETVINALLDSGLIVSAAWPLNTEMESRLRATESAALASSIYIVARKMARQGTGFYNEVREELRTHMNAKLQRLWDEGIGGADFFIAAIGSAIEVFGKYERVLDYEGAVVRADRLLGEVQTIATDYAVRQILHNGFAGEISDLARFYVLWRWNYSEARVPFDEARKLAQSVGIDLPREWGRSGSFIRKDKEFVQVLGPQSRKLDDLEDSRELIDVLHRVLLLWEKGQRAELLQVLTNTGYGKSEAFYRVAQAVSETLPNESREKKLLDGFLTGRERLQADLGNVAAQPRQGGLWDE